jgi:hypothetical protein
MAYKRKITRREGDERRRTMNNVISEKAKRALKRLEKEKLCSICYGSYDHGFWTYGNNAWPVNEGRCCHSCDETYVLPARIASLRREPA